MAQIKGPGIFLAQFAGDEAPFNTLENITSWAKNLGFKGVQIPIWESRFIDLDKAAESKDYCDELKGRCSGLEITELASHLEGQLVATHPAYDMMFDGFAPAAVHNNPKARAEWATGQMLKQVRASKNLGLSALVTFSGSLLWHTMYPWPQRPTGLVELGFAELVKRWRPILDSAEENGVDVCYELHPGEDLHDGATFERFLEATGNHPKVAINYDPSHFVLQCLDYVGFIDLYHEYIRAYHVKDAEFISSARAGVYGGYLGWVERPGRFRSLGDGEVDFMAIFSKLTQYGYSSWAVLEWECCLKDAAQGAAEGAPFIEDMLIETPKKAFDDFADGGADNETNSKILGISD
jgi:sugar phosphate isomerase/epimerase